MWSINQSINQYTYQSINKLICRSIGQSVDQPVNQSPNQSVKIKVAGGTAGVGQFAVSSPLLAVRPTVGYWSVAVSGDPPRGQVARRQLRWPRSEPSSTGNLQLQSGRLANLAVDASSSALVAAPPKHFPDLAAVTLTLVALLQSRGLRAALPPSTHTYTQIYTHSHTHTHTHTPVSYTHLTLPTRRTV